MKDETQTIAVVIEGGIVQTVVVDHDQPASLKLAIEVIDYDTDGADEADLSLVPTLADGPSSKARVYSIPLAKAGIDIDNIVPADSTIRY